MLNNIYFITGFWLLYFTILVVVWFIKEKLAWQPEAFGILYQPPFDCRKCMTVWMMVASYVSIAVIIGSFWFGFSGLLLSFGEYLALKYKDRQQIIE